MNRVHVDTSNLSRSCNEALILGSLRGGPRHGYQLALEIEERSKGVFGFNHGTLYPILHRLEKAGLISRQLVGRRRWSSPEELRVDQEGRETHDGTASGMG